VALAAKKGKKKDKGVYADTVLLPETSFSMRADAKNREPEIQKFWEDEDVYRKLLERESPLGKFTLHDGPPYANGSLHMGHALNKILKDIINKYRTYQGYQCKFIPGWDCHGLPIELKVVQSKQAKKLIKEKELTPLKLRQIAAEFALETVQEQRKSFERYGVWGDFDDPYLTLLPKYEAAQLGIFEEMVRGGHIYRGRKPVYWSPSTRTALAEAELEYPEEHTSQSIFAAFQCVEAPEKLSEKTPAEGLEVAVWTTTPWTIPANRAVAVNPDLEYCVVATSSPEGAKRRLVIAHGLVETLTETLGLEMTVEATFPGDLLEGLKYKHPITGVVTPVVLGGDYITTEAGTGLVHTAPGHGQDDYQVGLKYDLEVAAPVDNAGNFTAEVGMESLVGANVLKDANDRVIEVLKGADLLLLEQAYKHKYPYDWRSKKPVITRATPQWFASIDGLRKDCLEAVDNTNFIPPKYSNRMRPMIVGRNDWCISRQRSWGVPIPVFYHKDTEEPLMTPEIIAHVRAIVAEKGTNAWFELTVADLLPEEHRDVADQYVKGTDTMDVWFDSGSSWAAVKADLGDPEQLDLYLEGSDQHRGWFQSSLITSVAVSGKAPYKSVMTHGFCVDGDGRKMSKSVGNVVDPYTIIEGGKNPKQEPPLGADVLRLWAASVDFTVDVAISQSILGAVAGNYKTLRNRSRFLLGNINDFDPKEHAVEFEELPLLDQWQITEAEEAFRQMDEAYDAYSFARTTKTLLALLNDMSGTYLEIAKDRLYIDDKDSARRRSCQTVLRWLVENVARVVSPVLSHLGEDIWQSLPGGAETNSVFLSGWWKEFPRQDTAEPATMADFREVMRLREASNAALEKARNGKLVNDPLDAGLAISIPEDSKQRQHLKCLETSRQPITDNLACLLGVSSAVVTADAAPEDSEEAFTSVSEELGVSVTVRRAAGKRCERCYKYTEDVGDSEAHPQICSRCVDVVLSLKSEDRPEMAAA
jgi:isoleucyl-tRNA synthetase